MCELCSHHRRGFLSLGEKLQQHRLISPRAHNLIIIIFTTAVYQQKPKSYLHIQQVSHSKNPAWNLWMYLRWGCERTSQIRQRSKSFAHLSVLKSQNWAKNSNHTHFLQLANRTLSHYALKQKKIVQGLFQFLFKLHHHWQYWSRSHSLIILLQNQKWRLLHIIYRRTSHSSRSVKYSCKIWTPSKVR